MARDYAAVPHEYIEEMSRLSDAEFGRLIRALLNYSRSGEPIAPRGNERFYAERVMAEEDRHRKSYEELSERNSRAGKASAYARQQRAAYASEINDTESDSKIKTEKKGFFSYEKKAPRGYAAQQEKDRDAWMNDYD